MSQGGDGFVVDGRIICKNQHECHSHMCPRCVANMPKDGGNRRSVQWREGLGRRFLAEDVVSSTDLLLPL